MPARRYGCGGSRRAARGLLACVDERARAHGLSRPRRQRMRARFVTLAEGIEEVVRDDDRVAFEGFTHLIPFAAGHEAIRQRRKNLELVRMTPDILYDQMIGCGMARKLVFSWCG